MENENENVRNEYTQQERAELAASKRQYFSEVSKRAEIEYDNHRMCERCLIIGPECHRACGVLMKHRWRLVDVQEKSGEAVRRTV